MKILHAQLLAHMDEDAPMWARQRSLSQGNRRKVGRPMFPHLDPEKVGQIVYHVQLNGHIAKMLYDPGASHSFIDVGLANKVGLKIHPLFRRTTLQHFSGSTDGAIKGYCTAKDFEVAGKTYEWKFYAITPSPSEIILGLDYLMKYQPLVEFGSFAFWNTEAATGSKQEGEVEETCGRLHDDEDFVLSCFNLVDLRCSLMTTTIPNLLSISPTPSSPSTSHILSGISRTTPLVCQSNSSERLTDTEEPASCRCNSPTRCPGSGLASLCQSISQERCTDPPSLKPCQGISNARYIDTKIAPDSQSISNARCTDEELTKHCRSISGARFTDKVPLNWCRSNSAARSTDADGIPKCRSISGGRSTNVIYGGKSTSTNTSTLGSCHSIANQQVSRSASQLRSTTTLPYCEDGTLFLFSVTADSWEEQQVLQETLNAMPNELRELVNKHGRVFSPPDHEPPSRSVKHHIILKPDAVPIKRRPYPLPPKKLEAMRSQVEDLSKNHWIEPSTSPWGAPILFVPKKNGDLRMCVDFRDLNALTIDDSFPLPRIEVMLHKAAGARIFSKLDLASGFHQIEVAPEARELTAFRLPEAVNGSSLWHWKVMPFGLRNAPPTFQRAMTVTLAGLEHCAVVYIDDILVYSKNQEDHVTHLDQVFAALDKERYHMRLAKCEFMQRKVEFLGHCLCEEGISTQQDKVDAIKEWKTPFTTRKQVKSFLGVAVWYRVFIHKFSTIAAPLFELTSSRKRFRVDGGMRASCQQAQGRTDPSPCPRTLESSSSNTRSHGRLQSWRRRGSRATT